MKRIIRFLMLPTLAVAALTTPQLASAGTLVDTAQSSPVHSLALMAPATLEGTVNLNTATQKQLELLPGIGPATAAKIVAYRAKAPFKETLHLLRVKGVGRKTYAKIKPFLSVTGESDLHVVKGPKK